MDTPTAADVQDTKQNHKQVREQVTEAVPCLLQYPLSSETKDKETVKAPDKKLKSLAFKKDQRI